jgi:Glycosyl hydrolases family 15
MIVMLTQQMLGSLDHPQKKDVHRWRYSPSTSRRNLLNFMMSLGRYHSLTSSSNVCNGVRVRVGRLSELINTACIESMDFLLSKEPTNYQDWHSILKGNAVVSHNQSLKGQEQHHSPTSAVTPSSRKSSIRKPVRSESTLTKPLSSLQDTRFGHLRGHSAQQPSVFSDSEIKRSSSPSRLRKSSISMIQDSYLHKPVEATAQSPEDGEKRLHLNLEDPTEVEAAAAFLLESENLHDQADLLHYLHTTVGNDYFVKGLCKVSELLEEVYQKAMQMKQWSVVRQTAGLLRKTVNSITSNLADLLIRQKPTTIGLRPKEAFLDNPKNPKELSEIIFANWYTKLLKVAPAIREKLHWFKSLSHTLDLSSKAHRSCLTELCASGRYICFTQHFFIIAMREEISRMNRCDEVEAIEFLMEVCLLNISSARLK